MVRARNLPINPCQYSAPGALSALRKRKAANSAIEAAAVARRRESKWKKRAIA